MDPAGRLRIAKGLFLRCYIHHIGFATLIDMCKFTHNYSIPHFALSRSVLLSELTVREMTHRTAKAKTSLAIPAKILCAKPLSGQHPRKHQVKDR